MKRRNKTIDPVHDRILACPKCRQDFDSVRGIVETKALMTRHGYTLQSIRDWIRNDRYRAEQHQNAATSIAPPITGPVYVPQWVLVLCCRNLQYVEGTWPARYHFDDDENSRACTYSPLRPQCPSNEEVDIYGVIPHWLCKCCSKSLTKGNPLLTWPKVPYGSEADMCLQGCQRDPAGNRDKTLAIDLDTNSRYWVCTRSVSATAQPKMLADCRINFIDKMRGVVDRPAFAIASLSSSSSSVATVRPAEAPPTSAPRPSTTAGFSCPRRHRLGQGDPCQSQ